MCRNSYAPWLRLSLRFTFNVHVELIGMETCGGAHFLGRALREQRLEGQLIPAQYVKPYVKTNKSDYLDAEAIAEARRASSMVGSKAANGGQVKTGQRMWPGTQDVLPCRSHIRQA